MSSISDDLQLVLESLDPFTAELLSQTVKDAIRLAASQCNKTNIENMGYPKGYFGECAGAFANEPFDVARSTNVQLRLEKTPASRFLLETVVTNKSQIRSTAQT